MAVAGVNVGLVIQLAVVAAGLSWIVDLLALHFDAIRFIGAADPAAPWKLPPRWQEFRARDRQLA